jgi:hypothetical protein
MTQAHDGPSPFEQRIEDAIRRIPALAGRPRRYAVAAPAVASPTHRATASDCLRVEVDGMAPIFLKVRHADCAADLSPVAAEAARKAARLGVGPEVVCDAEDALGLAYLPEPWRYARVRDLTDLETMGQVMAAKRALHGDAPLGWRFCPFERVAALVAEARAAGAPLPDDTDRLVAACGLIHAAVTAAGVDLRFCHNDGVASNVMVGGGGVRLVDFDLAGDNDPWFDVGALMNEACGFDADRRAALELYAGRCEEPVFNRCRLYGAVDDVMQGLWGVTRAATSRRVGVEFYKYGTWRLFHAKATIASREFETWLRRL